MMLGHSLGDRFGDHLFRRYGRPGKYHGKWTYSCRGYVAMLSADRPT